MMTTSGVVLALMLCSTAIVRGETIVSPTVDGTVRDVEPDGEKDGSADTISDDGEVRIINAPWTEDRGVIEFSLWELPLAILNAGLILPVIDRSGPYPFTIDVLTYAGDGCLALSDWDEGAVLTSFEYSGDEMVILDVTSFIASAISAGYPYAGFNIRFAGPSNINPFRGTASYLSLGSVEYDSSALLCIAEVSEPDALTLMFIGLLIACSWRRRRWTRIVYREKP